MVAGRIDIWCQQGTSKDKRYKFYPYWRMFVVGDDGTQTFASITYKNLEECLLKLLSHERYVDETRERKPEHGKRLIDIIGSLVTNFRKRGIDPKTIPKIYTEFKKIGHNQKVVEFDKKKKPSDVGLGFNW